MPIIKGAYFSKRKKYDKICMMCGERRSESKLLFCPVCKKLMTDHPEWFPDNTTFNVVRP